MRLAFIVFFLFAASALAAQTPKGVESFEGVYLLETIVSDGDTIPVVTLRPATVSAQRKARSRRYQRKWSKLHRNVVKTYPYAQVAGELINEYNRNIKDLETEAEREVYIDRCEEDLKAEFEGDLRKMTVSQGRVLIKLIDRETGNTSYELIRDLKSGFSAFMWQGVAKLFGTDLKDHYDPESNETDAMIEEIVGHIEAGLIAVETREVKTPAAEEVLREKSNRLKRKIEREKRKQAKKEESARR
jgi:hypothetical protein